MAYASQLDPITAMLAKLANKLRRINESSASGSEAIKRNDRLIGSGIPYSALQDI